MFIVTGTQRSGTSLWMQILMAAGHQHLGQAFPGHWQQAFGEFNPRGFYETLFRDGIYYRTNPHPKTGRYLSPEQSRELVVKVFIPGLVRTDRAFMDRVVATIRPWREFCRSMSLLLEGESLLRGPEPPKRRLPPPEIVWWLQNSALIRDATLRRYPSHFVSFQALLERPEECILPVLDFLGGGDRDAALAVIDPSLRHHAGSEWRSSCLEPCEMEAFDRLHDRVYDGLPFDETFRRDMERTHEHIMARFADLDVG